MGPLPSRRAYGLPPEQQYREEKTRMISVIVPIYKVEQYLHRCLNSILAQTYPDLDIILIDDGSPDGCGKICDQYAEKDSRIRVFHTPNQGLSGARNLGIEKALEKESEYIAFVDSDDWLEPKMYETLVNTAEKTGCDVVVCGYFRDGIDTRRIWTMPEKRMEQTEAIRELIIDNLKYMVWNKLWKAQCFSSVRFLQGQFYEDVEAVYRLFSQIHELIRIPDPLYHYCIREDSISQTKDLSIAISKWKAFKKQYDDLSNDTRFVGKNDFQQKIDILMTKKTVSIWLHHKISREQLNRFALEVNEMNAFAQKHFPLLGNQAQDLAWKVFSLLARIHYTIPLKLAAFCRPFFLFFKYHIPKLH